MADNQPFDGIRVVEFGQFISVPYCAQLLAEGGARVIKVESLEGDPARFLAPIREGESRHYITRNRGKQVLPLDLRHEGSAPVLDALAGWADVILTNFRPGLAETFGLDFETLHAKHPRLILGNVTAFGRKGPDANLAGMDVVVQARSGLLHALGREVDGLPAGGDPSIVDYHAAMQLAFGVSSALLLRERTGRGSEVSASLLGSAMALQNTAMVRVEELDAEVHEGRFEKLAEVRARGGSFAEQAGLMPGNRVPWVSAVYFRTFMSKDAPVAIACASLRLQQALLRATGLVDERLGKPTPHEDPEFIAYYAAKRAEMEAIVASKTAAEWRPILESHGIPFSMIYFPAEVLRDQQAEANGLTTIVDHPILGPSRVFGPPVHLDEDGFRPVEATAPFGSDVLNILADLGFGHEEARSLVNTQVTALHLPGEREG